MGGYGRVGVCACLCVCVRACVLACEGVCFYVQQITI